ncbi:CWC22 [Cordylochernes scorpioides]|uniref:CWC22 n=1 Tax=Cordylochernes scorpioides TaxID=51811 RepID=A0ABY6KRZ9_9ARAC|nr:CWC22 [Cordylochernes scorpioides]
MDKFEKPPRTEKAKNGVKKAPNRFIYGNYNRYYGYRNVNEEDVRFHTFKEEWFRNKSVLDVGCNVGHLTLKIAKEYGPKKIIGIDIDKALIFAAKKNVRHYIDHNSSSFPISNSLCHGPILEATETPKFPNNIFFVQGNYVLSSDNLLSTQVPEYDTVLCLSVTKWIHLNWGDAGLKRCFRRIFLQLQPGGVLVLEAQPWSSYRKKKNLTLCVPARDRAHYDKISLKPEQFNDYLVKEVGFQSYELADVPSHCHKENEFDSYWEGESKNKNRNRIRVGKQYQARLPALLKPGESDGRCFQDLETLRWKPNRLPDDQIDQFITLANTLAGRDEPLVPTSHKVYHQGSNVQFNQQQPPSPSSPSGKASSPAPEESGPEVKAMRGKPRSPRLPDAESNASTRKADDLLTSKTGGAYIPPAKLRKMQEEITDKASIEYQRISWEALKKSIHGLINKVTVSNISIIVQEIFKENIIRGRGLLVRTIMQAQATSPIFTHIYSALVAIINTKFPKTILLLLNRLVVQFKKSFTRNNKLLCMSSAKFIAHLTNHEVLNEILALETLTLLLETPTDDSVEIAISFLKECGLKLSKVSPKSLHYIFERLRTILHEGKIDKRVQYMIEVMFAIRRDDFKDYPIVLKELDLVAEEDTITHELSLEDDFDTEDILNVFKFDPEFLKNEEKYKEIKTEILDDDSDESGKEDDDEEDDDDEEEEEESKEQEIIDNTETNLLALRRTIYLTIQSSLDFEECCHKLLKLEIKPHQVMELCHMILDCCAQQRTYEKFFGLLAQRFCQLNRMYVDPFVAIFKDAYDTIHRFETNKLRNVAKFFSHLFYTDAIPWDAMAHIKLNEDDTTSSSRIFIKILFQELCEFMGLPKLNERVKDPTLSAFEGLFPRDNPRNTRFAINFFTSIGLGGLTDELREHLKTSAEVPQTNGQAPAVPSSSSDSSSSDSSSSSSSSSESSSSSDDSSSSDSSSSSSESSSDSSDHDSRSKKRPVKKSHTKVRHHKSRR